MIQYQLTVVAQLIEGTATIRDTLPNANVTDTTITVDQSDTVVVPGGSTDLAVPLSAVATAKHLAFTVTGGAISFKLNGSGNTAYTIQDGGVVVLSGAAITAMHVTNAGSVAVTLKRIAAG